MKYLPTTSHGVSGKSESLKSEPRPHSFPNCPTVLTVELPKKGESHASKGAKAWKRTCVLGSKVSDIKMSATARPRNVMIY